MGLACSHATAAAEFEILTVLRAVLLGDDFTRGLDRPGQQHDHVGRRDVGIRRVLDALCDAALSVRRSLPWGIHNHACRQKVRGR